MVAAKSFVVSYNPDMEQLEVFSVKDDDLAAVREKNVIAPWRLEDIPGGELTENVASRLGATALGILALYHPEIKTRLRVKPEQFPLP